jgi:hypothetical protein
MNIVHVYHVSDPYDHSAGYAMNNTYRNVDDDYIKAILARQEKYLNGKDIGGYLIHIMTYEVGQEPKHEHYMKCAKEKQRIELNVRAKRNSMKKPSNIEDAVVGINAMIPQHLWAHAVNPAADIQVQIQENEF